MATGRAAPAGLRQIADPTRAGQEGLLIAADSRPPQSRQIGCRLAPDSRANGPLSRRVRDRLAASTVVSHFNSVPTRPDVKVATISGRGSRTVLDRGRIRRKARFGYTATTRSPPLWQTSNAVCAV